MCTKHLISVFMQNFCQKLSVCYFVQLIASKPLLNGIHIVVLSVDTAVQLYIVESVSLHIYG